MTRMVIALLVVANLLFAFFVLTGRGPETHTPVAPPPGATAPAGDLCVELMAADLRLPTSFVFLPGEGNVLYTEVTGTLGMLRGWKPVPAPVMKWPVNFTSDRGLLGVALAPDFESSRRFYVFQTMGDVPKNRILLCELNGDSATIIQTVIDDLPSGGVHNGGVMRFGPDGKLYATTGDGVDEAVSPVPQYPLGGKILRLEPDGAIPADNPSPDSPVYAKGFRNSFGMCFDPASDRLYCTDNGPETNDEVNLVERGADYGWPRGIGVKQPALPLADFETAMGITGILVYRGSRLPGYDGAAFVGDSNFGYVWVLGLSRDGRALTSVRHIPGSFGIVTDIRQGPDDRVYFATYDGLFRITGPSGVAVSGAPGNGPSRRGGAPAPGAARATP